ncbi:MAG TPA: 6-phosphogluconolactonase [Bacteroidales bacterium]|nr:6-phosphogluconolactonase [Bacteroidales bacterium]
MVINICSDAQELGIKAAVLASKIINEAIAEKDEVRIAVSTGSSQFETLQALMQHKIDWQKVEIFHLDEYIGLPVTHPASFRKYLYERFINHINVKVFHSVDVEGDIKSKIMALTAEIRKKPIDLGLIGIGVNGHIAFNDPPADFDTKEAYKIVDLDEVCRKQQVDEGWFGSMKEVPLQAVSMTPYQIMQCNTIISSVPHKVKATAIRNTLVNKLTEVVPATLLKQHADYHLYIDKNSSSEIIPF